MARQLQVRKEEEQETRAESRDSEFLDNDRKSHSRPQGPTFFLAGRAFADRKSGV